MTPFIPGPLQPLVLRAILSPVLSPVLSLVLLLVFSLVLALAPRLNRARPVASALLALAAAASIALAGCFDIVDRPGMPTPLPTAVATPTPTPTPTPPPTPTPTPPPTPPPTPTPTPRPTPPPTPTPWPTPTPTPTPTPPPAPFVQVDEPTFGATINTPSINVRGTTIPGALVTANGHRAAVNQDGEFRAFVPLSLGINVIEVIAANFRGDEARVFVAVTYALPSPQTFTLSLNAPPDGLEAVTEFLEVNGTTLPRSTVSVNGVVVRVDAQGAFSTLVQLSPGVNVINVVAQGPDGQRQQQTRTVTFSQ